MRFSRDRPRLLRSDKSPGLPGRVVSSISCEPFIGIYVHAKPKIALNPKRPERICWGCDKLRPANDLRCGNGTIRTQHPVELFGDDWLEWELDDQSGEPQPRT